MPIRFHLLLSSLILASCLNESPESIDDVPVSIPDHLSHLENLTVYPADPQLPDTVLLTRETVFESNEDLLMSGYIRELAIDENDRVYIGSNVPGNLGVYAFEPDGSYITTIGNYGRGPGELESIGSIHIQNNQLYLLGPQLQKISVYALDSFDLMEEFMINMVDVSHSDSILSRLSAQDLFVTDDEKILLRFSMITPFQEQEVRKIRYYQLDDEGNVMPGKLLEMKRYPFYFPKENQGIDFPFAMPFTRSSLVAIANDGSFFTAWTEDFLIKHFDKNGNYGRAFYYPMSNSPLSIDDLDISNYRQRVLKQYRLPETWPALHHMILDDEDRLWVATITNSDTTFKWWVLNPDGELIARFTFSGERASRHIMSYPITEVRNNYLYVHESDIRNEVDRIVKYRIEFIQN